jgi:hypothetical protein
MVGDDHAIGCSDSDTVAHAPGRRRVWLGRRSSPFGTVASTRKRRPLAEQRERQVPRELEPAVQEGGPKTGHELAAKNAPGHRDGNKEPIA